MKSKLQSLANFDSQVLTKEQQTKFKGGVVASKTGPLYVSQSSGGGFVIAAFSCDSDDSDGTGYNCSNGWGSDYGGSLPPSNLA